MSISNRDRIALKEQHSDPRFIAKALRVMQLTAALLLICSLSLSAHSVSQTVSIQNESISFEKIFYEIKKQTGYSIVTGQASFDKSATLSLNIRDMDLELFMEKILLGKPYAFEIKSKTIFIKEKSQGSKVLKEGFPGFSEM